MLSDPFLPSALVLDAFAPPTSSKRRKLQQGTSEECGASDGDIPRSDGVQALVTPREPASAASAAGGAPPAQPEEQPSACRTESEQPLALLPSELLSELDTVRVTLHEESMPDDVRAARCAPGLSHLLALSDPAAVRAACEKLDVAALPDEAVHCVCQAAALPDVSSRSAGALISSVVLPRLLRLEQPASRTLFAALLALLQVHARAVLDELVLPTVWCNDGALSAAQAEAVSRLLKELPEALLGRFVSQFLRGDADQPSSWAEAQVVLLQVVLSRKPVLDGACVAELVVQADANVEALRGSLKFSNMLNTLVRFHAPQLRPHVLALRRVAEKLETFMKRSILQAVSRCEQQQ